MTAIKARIFGARTSNANGPGTESRLILDAAYTGVDSCGEFRANLLGVMIPTAGRNIEAQDYIGGTLIIAARKKHLNENP